jgi:MerR family transcriptional regulator/heat shock protein HspR
MYIFYTKTYTRTQVSKRILRMTPPSAAQPVYSIAVAAELAGLPAATLRLYEQKGLLAPARTAGGTRRYSEDDVARLRQVAALQEDGVNLAGIGMVLDLQGENEALRREIAESEVRSPRESAQKSVAQDAADAAANTANPDDTATEGTP